jgi:osmotically inducible lipoprotein OsmB
MHMITVLAALAVLGLASCGESTEERAASGGVIGGAAGLAVGAPIAGAAVGAGTGALTDEDDF